MFLEQVFGTAIGFILMFGYFGYRRIAGYALFVDVALGAFLVWAFAGTFAGMITGMLASLIITVYLKLYRKLFGYERFELMRKRGQILPRGYWVRYEPEWSLKRTEVQS